MFPFRNCSMAILLSYYVRCIHTTLCHHTMHICIIECTVSCNYDVSMYRVALTGNITSTHSHSRSMLVLPLGIMTLMVQFQHAEHMQMGICIAIQFSIASIVCVHFIQVA